MYFKFIDSKNLVYRFISIVVSFYEQLKYLADKKFHKKHGVDKP